MITRGNEILTECLDHLRKQIELCDEEVKQSCALSVKLREAESILQSLVEDTGQPLEDSTEILMGKYDLLTNSPTKPVEEAVVDNILDESNSMLSFYKLWAKLSDQEKENMKKQLMDIVKETLDNK